MPFILVDEKKKAASDGNGFDELPPGVTPDQLSKLITEVLSEQLTKLVNKALRSELYRLTGNMNYYDAPE